MSNNKSKFSLIPEFELFFSGYGAYHHNPVYDNRFIEGIR